MSRTSGRPSKDTSSQPVVPAGAERVEDIRAIRALAHPLRLQILDLLREQGPLTATQIARLLDNSTPNCAFHLRTLAKYGFIEEVEGKDRRERPWQVRTRGAVLDPDAGGAAHRRAVQAATAAHRRIAVAKHAAWEDWEPSAPSAWREAAFEMDYEGALTPEELSELGRTWQRLVMQVLDRPDREVPEGAQRVHVRGLGFPIAPVTIEGGDTPR